MIVREILQGLMQEKKRVTDGPTDRRTDGPTDRRTDGREDPNIESLVRD